MKFLYLFLFLSLIGCHSNSKKDIFDVARHGTVSDMAILIEENAQIINKKNKAGYTPLILASYNNNKEIVPYLIKKGAQVNQQSDLGTALMAASYKGNNIIVKILLKKGANVNSSDSKGTTALHYACVNQNTKLVKLLVKNKAKIDVKDHKRKTPLDYAIEKNNIEIIQILKPN
jgi:ankyrin repeat protein